MATEATWADDVAAAALVLPSEAAFSHTTAAQILRLPLPIRLMDERPLHATTPRRGGRRHLIRWHEAPIDTVTVAGLPVTDPRRTWCDLAPLLALPELAAVADVILRRSPHGLWVPFRTRGAVLLRRALDLADPRSNSPRESMLRVALHEAGLPAPAINRDIVHRGEWVGCGDFVWEEYGLYVEFDGRHHDNPGQRHQDAQTRNRLMELGWTVRVITSRMGQDEAVGIVRQALQANGWR